MSNRKQRKRRAKDFRHDVRVFEVDGEGNEVPIAELRSRDEKPAAKPARGGGKKGQTARPPRGVRVPPEPSWDRAFRRGGLMGAVLLVAFLFLFTSQPIAVRVVWGGLYAVAFVPITYWIDRTAYRSYQKRAARRPK